MGESEQLRVLIDGVETGDVGATAASLLVSEEPRLELLRPNTIQKDPSAVKDPPKAPSIAEGVSGRDQALVSTILAKRPDSPAAEWLAVLKEFNDAELQLAAKDPSANKFSVRFGMEQKGALLRTLLLLLDDAAEAGWDAETLAQALKALRILSREASADTELKTDRATVTVGRMAGLSEDGAHWTEATGEAFLLLKNLLILGKERPARILRDQLGAEPRILGKASARCCQPPG